MSAAKPTIRLALAIEVEIPAGVDPLALEVAEVRLRRIDGGRLPETSDSPLGVRLVARHLGVGARLANRDVARIVRAEVHPDPDAVFPPDDEARGR